MRRLALLIAAGTLWLFLAALPVLADGGPHVAVDNSGVSTLTADGCAGCHRAHTAQAPMLLADEQPTLCLNCHGSGGVGSAVDVEAGVQFEAALAIGSPAQDPDVDPILGALRGGGFVFSRIGSSENLARFTYYRNATDVSTRPKVGVLSTGAAVTSVHLDIANPSSAVAWGAGPNGATFGESMTLECTSCHNPHGNGQYRILRPVPHDAYAEDPAAVLTVDIEYYTAFNNRFVTTDDHALVIGAEVDLAGNSAVADGTYTIASTPTTRTFTLVGVTTGSDGTGGTFTTTNEVAVTDAPLPADGDTRNYTILQIKGGQGLDSSYLLYASQVVAAAATDSVSFDPVNITKSVASNDRVYTGANNPGLSTGDRVTIAGHDGTGADGTWTVRDVAYDTAVGGGWYFRLYDGAVAVDITSNGTAAGTVTRDTISGEFGSLGGDYFHRTVPWNPMLTNPDCDPLISASSTGTGAQPGNAAACGTANDAPNGRPSTVTAAGSPINGQVAFNDEITAWCVQCHTRYYAAIRPNPGGGEPTSAQSTKTITSASAATNLVTSASHGYNVGDLIEIAGTTDAGLNATWYVRTVPSANTFSVSLTATGAIYDIAADSTGGTALLTGPVSAQSWWYPRPGETGAYMYQHQTTGNRACVTCHVSHGSNAIMDPGPAATVEYPDGTTIQTVTGSPDSRLLKVDNRGTCQACHDPTETVESGTLLYYLGDPAAVTEDTAAPYPDMPLVP